MNGEDETTAGGDRSKRGRARRGRKPFTYEQGRVSIAEGSTVLRGIETGWSALAQRGLPAMPLDGQIVIEGGDEIYEVNLVNADGLMTLKKPFMRPSVDGATYHYVEASTLGEAESETDAQVQTAGVSSSAAVKAEEEHSSLGEAVRTIAYALLIALVIRAFFFQPFNIPSESMVPTLLKGDYIFVSKFSYGFSRHSLPWSPPLFSGRVFGSLPKRGDVAVFKLPSDGHTDYIKRVVGLPGDRIQVREGQLYINGEPVKRERVEDFVNRDSFGSVTRTPMYRETFDTGRTFLTLDMERQGAYDNTREFIVPEGHLFMMGDNRDNSMDSRAAPDLRAPREGGVGYVPLENLVGKANVIFFSTDGSAHFWEIWRWPAATRWARLFKGLN